MHNSRLPNNPQNNQSQINFSVSKTKQNIKKEKLKKKQNDGLKNLQDVIFFPKDGALTDITGRT